MNVHFSEVVGEILCGNTYLDSKSDRVDFEIWCEELALDIDDGFVDINEYPNHPLYINDPYVYWPYVEKVLKG